MAAQFGIWCVVDVLYVRFHVRSPNGSFVLLPLLAMGLFALVPTHSNRVRAVVSGVLLGFASWLVALALIYVLGVNFHFLIGGQL